MSEVDFERWHPLSGLTVKDLPVSNTSGFVYILRKSGTKEILYVGSTENLLRRIFGNYLGGVGGETTQRIHKLLFEEGAIADTEIAWKQTLNHKLEEKRLRHSFYKAKGRLPLWNRQM